MDAGRLGKSASVPCFVALQECKTGLFPLVLFLLVQLLQRKKDEKFYEIPQ